MSFYKKTPFAEGYVEIESETPNFKEVTFLLTTPIGTCTSIINALWEIDFFGNSITTGPYYPGDYFQQTIKADPPGQKFGPMLHDFIIQYKDHLGFLLNNIYSTNEVEDGYHLNEIGRKFWEKRRDNKKAEYLEDADRFKILWK